MSTWINRVLLFPLLISGCVAPGIGAGQSGTRQSSSLAGLTVRGPSGFCPADETKRRISGAEFVAFVPCGTSSRAILATTIGAAGSAEGISLTKAVMGPYFETSEGKAALRGDGRDDAVSVHEVTESSGAVVLRLTRNNQGRAVNSWRALMQIGGRLVTLSVRPRQGMALSSAEGRRLISGFVTAMQSANRR